MKENVRLLFEKYARASFGPDQSVLEVGAGGGRSELLTLAGSDAKVWHTLDVSKGPELTYSGADPYHYPIPDETYDIVIASQVLEHVPKVWVWIKELVASAERAAGSSPSTRWATLTTEPRSAATAGESIRRAWRALYDEAGLRVELSVCETLEVPGYRRYWPRYSFFDLPWPARLIMRALAPIGFPIVCAEDTITIGQKPLDGSPHENTTK